MIQPENEFHDRLKKVIDAGPVAKPISHRDTRDELGMRLPWGVLI